MNKSITPLFSSQSPFFNKKITDEELMNLSEVFANTDIKPSSSCLQYIKNFSAATETLKTKNQLLNFSRN